MEVFDRHTHELIFTIFARGPKFLARGLLPGRSLFLRVYASNSKGRSRSVTFDAYTLRMADKHPGKNRFSIFPSKDENALGISLFLKDIIVFVFHYF